MKRLILILAAGAFLAACNNSDKKESGNDPASPASNDSKSVASGDDAALTSWLGGKMLSSTSADPKTDMWHNMKLNADGTCTDKDNASAKWEIKNGEFVFHAAMDMKRKIEKKDDTTVIFKGSIGDDSYRVSPIK